MQTGQTVGAVIAENRITVFHLDIVRRADVDAAPAADALTKDNEVLRRVEMLLKLPVHNAGMQCREFNRVEFFIACNPLVIEHHMGQMADIRRRIENNFFIGFPVGDLLSNDEIAGHPHSGKSHEAHVVGPRELFAVQIAVGGAAGHRADKIHFVGSLEFRSIDKIRDNFRDIPRVDRKNDHVGFFRFKFQRFIPLQQPADGFLFIINGIGNNRSRVFTVAGASEIKNHMYTFLPKICGAIITQRQAARIDKFLYLSSVFSSVL